MFIIKAKNDLSNMESALITSKETTNLPSNSYSQLLQKSSKKI